MTACSGAPAGVNSGGLVPATADGSRTAQYANALPIYANALPIYANALPICAAPGPSQAACNAVESTTSVYPAGTAAATLPGLHPADLQSAYDLPSQTNGRGQTIGIIVAGDDAALEADLSVYRSTFGLPPCTSASRCLQRLDEHGGTHYPPPTDPWKIEASIDVDIASAVCPNCGLLVIEAQSTSPADLVTAAQTAVALGADVLSNSYASTEAGTTAQQVSPFDVPSASVAYVVGTGDAGAGSTLPAALPFTIAVGGTSLTRGGGTRGWTETAWQGSGGGCSAIVPQPAWQAAYAGACRMRWTADISAFADPNPGAAIYVSSIAQGAGWRTFGGTSVATPLVAATIALAGNGKQLTNASYLYAHASAFNAVAGAGPGIGLGSPNGIAGL